jgi:hypothetical protein
LVSALGQRAMIRRSWLGVRPNDLAQLASLVLALGKERWYSASAMEQCGAKGAGKGALSFGFSFGYW